MKKLFVFLVTNILSFVVVQTIVPSVMFTGIGPMITLAFVLAILNSTLKPLLNVLTLPLNVLTFGLFSALINCVVLSIGFAVVPGAFIGGFGQVIFAAIVLGLTNGFISKMLGD
ncbi:MAG: phage holin family protein [Erysipelotrichaceae bacterium]|nr:phage holin family protein [Erysipelotrichaceae bacterium]